MADFFLDQEAVLRISRRALDLLRPRIKPRSLREGAEVVLNANNEIEVQFPFFWASFYHDGHGPSVARRGRILVFFRVPERDPRYRRFPPRTVQDVRRLTKEEFRQAKAADEIVIARMTRGWKGDPFLNTFVGLGDARLESILDDRVREIFDEVLPDRDFGPRAF
jgi:hypothetical protein